MVIDIFTKQEAVFDLPLVKSGDGEIDIAGQNVNEADASSIDGMTSLLKDQIILEFVSVLTKAGIKIPDHIIKILTTLYPNIVKEGCDGQEQPTSEEEKDDKK